MKILMADDDQGTRDLVKRALESDGHDVTAVSDGTAAVEAAAAGGFDLLIADIDMPGHDGVTVAKKAREAKAELAIVLISAHETQLQRAADINGGGVEVLVKPFSLEAIRKAVAAAA